MITIIPQDRFASIPWKNGGGVTHDVLLEPPGATHEDFVLRVSIAPITAEGPFSSFPGIERTITRLDPAPLELVFGDGRVLALVRFRPETFDSVLAPVSRLPGGPTKVINVMTRRGLLSAVVSVVAGPGSRSLAIAPGQRAVLYAASGDWTLADEAGEHRLPAGDAALASDQGLSVAGGEGGRLLVAVVSPPAGG